MPKISSVLELSKFKVGQTVYWVVFRPVDEPKRPFRFRDHWMSQVHPKVFYDRKIFSPLWKSRRRLPRLHAADFCLVTHLVTQRPMIEAFTITELSRSTHTGEFFYINQHGEKMPEKFLFGTQSQAEKERQRIKKIITETLEKWA